MKKYFVSSQKTKAPLSGACQVGDFVYLSGQIHVDKNLNLIGDSVQERFKVIMERVEEILLEAGLKIKDIVRVQIYLTNLDELKELNEVYQDYFSHPMPARTAVEVSRLPLGASLEIDFLASK